MCNRLLRTLLLVVGFIAAVNSYAEEVEDMPKTIVVEETIPGSLDRIWNAWTTTEGITAFFASEAKIELKIGGPFELYFAPDAPESQRGSEGCEILSYLPNEMLSFSWNAPPSIPSLRNAGARTWVVVQFEELDSNHVKIKITQQGFGTGEDWEKYYDYFVRAWPNVAEACRKYFADNTKD